MNPDQLSHKTQEALTSAPGLAKSSGHVEFTPVHLALTLLSDTDGILHQFICSAADDHQTAGKSAQRVFTEALKQLLAPSSSQDEIVPGDALKKMLDSAHTARRACGDALLAVDQLILSLLDDPGVRDSLKDAGCYR